MERITTPDGTIVSYAKSGNGPPLVLVHGGFSDHHTNWEFVQPILKERFTLYAIARRGRGETARTEGHSVEDETSDLVALIQSVGTPVFLLGHSYAGHCSLAAALRVPDRIRKLVLYEPAWPRVLAGGPVARLEELAAAGDWHNFAMTFFSQTLLVPVHELEALHGTQTWTSIIDDAKATVGDLRAIAKYRFNAEPCCQLQCPVLLQIGSESPRHLYVTDE